MILNLLLITALAKQGPGCGSTCGKWTSSSSHYTQGDCVIYNGDTYCAQWWTQAKPGTDGSWKKKITTTTRPPRPTVGPLQPTGIPEVDALINKLQEVDDEGIFLYETPNLKWEPSTVYYWDEMIKAVQIMADKGIGKMKFFPGDDQEKGFKYGLVNVAAFLSQCMQETIRYNACDENNWSDSKVQAKYGGSVYPASSACGQLGQSYQDYKCFGEEVEDMACEVDPEMEIRAITRATWYGAPPQLFCAPKSKTGPTPRWDVGGSWCAPDTYGDYISPYAPLDEYLAYMNNGGTCRDVKDQKDGHWVHVEGGSANLPAPSTNTPARTDVEGCCWWGRGVIQTTGTCNFGKLNYYLGTRAKNRGADALYPEINFCKDPEVICRDDGPPELKWISGLFYWMESVQAWDDGDFNYMEKLENWVDAGMDLSDTSLVDAASGIVNRGCPKTVCAAGEVHALQERRDNFMKVMEAMKSVFDTPVKTQKPIPTEKAEPTTTKAIEKQTTTKVNEKQTTTKTVIDQPTSTQLDTVTTAACNGYWRTPMDTCEQYRKESEFCNLSTDLRCEEGLVCDDDAHPKTHLGVCRKKDATTPRPVCGTNCNGYCRFDKCVSYMEEGEECNYSTQLLCATHLVCDMGSKDAAPGSSGICKKIAVKTCENCGFGYCHQIKHECSTYRTKGEKCNGSLDDRCADHLYCDYPDTISHKRRQLQSLAGIDGICKEHDFSPKTTEVVTSLETTQMNHDPSEYSTTEREKHDPCPSNLFLSNSELTDEQCLLLCTKDAESCLKSGQCKCVGAIQVSENAASTASFSLAILLLLHTLF